MSTVSRFCSPGKDGVQKGTIVWHVFRNHRGFRAYSCQSDQETPDVGLVHASCEFHNADIREEQKTALEV